MTIDISKIRYGDTVTLMPLKVQSVVQSGVRVANSHETSVFFPTRMIAEHHPQRLKVGDRVSVSDYCPSGEIMAIDREEFAIVKFSDNARRVYALGSLFYVGGSQ